jgi:hypothetical protein
MGDKPKARKKGAAWSDQEREFMGERDDDWEYKLRVLYLSMDLGMSLGEAAAKIMIHDFDSIRDRNKREAYVTRLIGCLVQSGLHEDAMHVRSICELPELLS